MFRAIPRSAMFAFLRNLSVSRASPSAADDGQSALDGLSAFASEDELPQARWEIPPAPPRAVRSRAAFDATRLATARPVVLILTMAGGALGGLFAVWLGTAVGAEPASGTVTISSVPDQAVVSVDGAPRGQTPLTLMLSPGPHRVEIGEGADVHVHHVSVSSGGEASVHVERRPGPADVTTLPDAVVTAKAPPAVEGAREKARAPAAAVPPGGWLSITSAVALQIAENGASLGSTDVSRIRLAAGTHALELTNVELDYRVERTVEIRNGRTTTFGLETPRGTLHVNAQPWAEVWVDGQRMGETPLGNLSLPIGRHELLLRHPGLGEERRTVIVGATRPTHVGVELNK